MRILRWLPAGALTVFFLVLLSHKSMDPQVLGRYSAKYLCFALGIGLCAAMAGWVALKTERITHLAEALQSLPIFSVTGLALSLLFVADILVDLDRLVPWLPYVVAFGIQGLTIWGHRHPSRSDPAAEFTEGDSYKDRLSPSRERLQRGGSSLLSRLSIQSLSIVGALVLCELAFRVFLLKPALPQTESDFEKIIASHWPRPISAAKPPGTFRIVGLCDSFGWMGGTQNYHYALESELVRREYQVEVVNLSKPELQPVDELEMLRRFGERFSPDLVLHGFFVGNDFSRAQGQMLTYGGLSVRKRVGTDALRPRGSYLLEWLQRRLKVWHRPASGSPFQKASLPSKEGSPPPSGGEGEGDHLATFSEKEFSLIEKRLLDLLHFSTPTSVPLEEVLPTLQSIRTEAERMGARYVMVIHPDELQVEATLRQELTDSDGVDWKNYDLERVQRFLQDYCTSGSIPCCDLLPAFRKEGFSGGLYLLRDTHYNDKGNALASQEIADFLEQAAILPSPRVSESLGSTGFPACESGSTGPP